MRNIYILFLLLAAPALLTAQVQRLVLAEEFTQASCGPCAAQNPAFNALLDANSSKIISIKYQVNWPGYDPMNEHNPTQVNTRRQYYSVTGVPYTRIDGVAPTGTSYVGAPANFNQVKLNTASAVMSPMSVRINHTISSAGDSIYVNAVFKAEQAVTGDLRAHIVVIEREIKFETPPGTNGEKEFYNVMKRMLPTDLGTTLPATMSAGDSVEVNVSWKVENIYDLSEVAVVAFVQDNNTKVVHQAGYSAPNLPLSLSMNNVSSKIKIPGSGGSSSYTINFTPQSNITQTYRIKANKNLPSGWSATMSIDGNNFTDSIDVSIASNTSKTINVTLNSGTSKNQLGVIEFVGHAANQYQTYTVKSKVSALSDVSTLLIDKHGTYNSIIAGTVPSHVQISGDDFMGLSAVDLVDSKIEQLFINTGDMYSNIFTDPEIANITAYLQSGGDLLITGQDIGYNAFEGGGTIAFRNFYNTYLGAKYEDDGDDSGLAINAFSNDQYFGTLGSTNLNTVPYTLYSDHVSLSSAATNAKAILMYGTDSTDIAGVRNESPTEKWRVVYVPFRLEALASSQVRSGLVDLSIQYFNSAFTGIEFDQKLNALLKQNYPNPANKNTVIEFGRINSDDATLSIYDIYGKLMVSAPLSVGQNSLVISTEVLPVGAYFYNLNIDGKISESKKMNIIR